MTRYIYKQRERERERFSQHCNVPCVDVCASMTVTFIKSLHPPHPTSLLCVALSCFMLSRLTFFLGYVTHKTERLVKPIVQGNCLFSIQYQRSGTLRGERARQRQTDRQTDRDRDRDGDTDTETQRQRQRDRNKAIDLSRCQSITS